MPRGTDSGGLKGVTVVRGGKEYAVTLPRFGQSTNASSINLNRDDLHEHFRKLTPKQRIAVLTIRDQNIATKLYTISNNVWFHEMQRMRNNIGVKDEDDALIRQFCNGFEYLFGEADDDHDSDHDEKQPILQNRKSCNSSIATATNRPINATFSYTSSDPTVFKAKLNFISTKDVVRVMMDGSKDFCASKARSRCRLLQRPEMWNRFLDVKDVERGAVYESMIYQLMEFRLMWEYLNGGAGGAPFANIKKAYPTDEEKWMQKEKELNDMEAGQLEAPVAVSVVVLPKKTRKRRMMEKIMSVNQVAVSTNNKETSSSSAESSDDEDSRRTSFGTRSSSTVEAIIAPPSLAVVSNDEDNDDDWIEVGAPKRKNSTAEVVLPKYVNNRQDDDSFTVSKRRALNEWAKTGTNMYRSDKLKAIAVVRKTFIEIILFEARGGGGGVGPKTAQESPF